MRTWHSTYRLCTAAAVAVLFTGCGSDFGGDPSIEAGLAADGGRNDARPEGGSAVDGGTPDTSAPADAGGTDARQDVGTTTDAGGSVDASSDAAGGSDAASDSGARDARTDAADATDARADTSIDTGIPDTGRPDSTGGNDGPIAPGCGNGIKEGTEECDDGNTRDFDGCSSLCTDRKLCECCILNNTGGMPMACAVDGDAETGPRTGTPRAQLCGETYACMLKSRCGTSGELLECYCGAGNTSGTTCIANPRGPCIAELEGAMEVEGATWNEKAPIISNRMTDVTFGGGTAGARMFFEIGGCPSSCNVPPQNGGECPDPGDAGPSGDATIDTVPGVDAADASAEGASTSDVTAPPDVSTPIDTGTADTGGGPTDGPIFTVDKDCDDCVTAALAQVPSPKNCDELTGTAAAGPAAGVSKQQLCHEALDCIHQTNCHQNAAYDCYCGTVIDYGTCYTTTSQTTGVCKTQLERALEVPAGSAGSVALDRLTDAAYAGGVAGLIANVEGTDPYWQGGCRAVCIPYTPTQ